MSSAHGEIALLQLERWLKASPGGYIHPSIYLARSRELGIHWRSREAIEAGTRLFTVPHSHALSYLNALVDDAYPVFQTRRKDFTIEAIGVLYLMLNYTHRDKSFCKPYLDTLPPPREELTTPLWFDDADDMAWLDDTDVWRASAQRREVYEQYYKSGLTILQQAGVDVSMLSWDLFRWAVTMFTSRSFSSRAIAPQDSKYWTTYKTGPNGQRQVVLLDMSHTPAEDLDFPVLFPVIDAGNHNHTAKAQWNFDPGRFSLGISEPVAADEEVHNNYGPKDNAELLMGYGFCIMENPYDVVQIAFKAPHVHLQEELKGSFSGYFDSHGEWDTTKATFRLPRLDSATSEQRSVFAKLPESLVELLILTIRFERGLPFKLDFTLDNDHSLEVSAGAYRYLPHVARLLSQSLAAKLAKLRNTTLSFDPGRVRQVQAKVYRNAQIDIVMSYLSAFRDYTSKLVPNDPVAALPSVCLMTLEQAVRCFEKSNATMVTDFMAGIKKNANTDDIEQLRLAGWEDDVWVLLLCYAWLWTRRNPGGSLVLCLMDALCEEYPLESAEDSSMADSADQAMSLVRTAAEALPSSLWADTSWTTHFLAAFGGRVLASESFVVSLVDDDGQHEQRVALCLYSAER